MSYALKLAVCGAVLMSGTALAQSGTTGQQGGTTRGGTTGRDTMMESGMQEAGKQGGMTMTMPEFVEELRQGNQFEMQLASTVQNAQVSGQVKEFARMLTEDHRTADTQLNQAAKNVSKTTAGMGSEKMRRKSEHRQIMRDMMSDMQGEDLERMFLTTVVMAHDSTVSMMNKMRPQADQQLKQYIDQQLPKMVQHRQRAYELLGRNAPRPATATSR
jgi:putative membrane protein